MWITVKLEDICNTVSGYAFKSKEFQLNGIPVIKIANVGYGEFLVKQQEYLTEDYLNSHEPFRIFPNDILIALTRPITDDQLKVCIYPVDEPIALLNQRVAALKPVQSINRSFIFYFFRSNIFRELVKRNLSETLQPNLSPKNLKKLDIPLPPLNEQHRIVAKIEALTDRSRKARAALDAIPALLDQFRQSVLAAAFRGDLTADWRSQNPDVEPAETLLERIREERWARWEAAELEKMKAKGKVPKNDKWKEKYKEIDSIKQTDLPFLPKTWFWVKLDNLIALGPQNGLYLPQTKYGKGIPIIRIDNFQDEWSHSSDELQKVDASDSEIALYSLQQNDLVINRVNSPSHLGKALLVEDRHLPALFESNMMRLKLVESISSNFVETYLRSPVGRKALTKSAKWAVNQASINQTDVKNTLVPLIPFQEQIQINQLVNQYLAKLTGIAEFVQDNYGTLTQLDQSILTKAFRGELVPQDPNDEPASVLLESIRAEREKGKGAKGKGKR